MEKISSFKNLLVWQKSMRLAEDVYSFVKFLPANELYGLSSQMRRCAISIPSNIAEGHKKGTKDFVRFLKIAYGSSAELETQLLLCERIYPHQKIQELLPSIVEIEKMLSVIIKKLNSVE